MGKIRKFFRRLYEIGEAIDITVTFLVLIVMWIYMLYEMQPILSPLITGGLALILTLTTFQKWTTAVMSILGITIYILSWPATAAWGEILGMLVWSVGFSLWCFAVYRANRSKRPKKLSYC